MGALYGLLGFAVILLLKATSVANFAQGALATLGAFIVYEFVHSFNIGFWLAFCIAIPVTALIGAVLYAIALRPNDDADHLNFLIRTLSLSLLIIGAITSSGQPVSPLRFPP